MIKQRKNIIAAIDIGSSKILCGMAKILGDGELEIISKYIHRFRNVTILIDDVRLMTFIDRDNSYPTLFDIVNWLFDHSFECYIESDILIAKLIAK